MRSIPQLLVTATSDYRLSSLSLSPSYRGSSQGPPLLTSTKDLSSAPPNQLPWTLVPYNTFQTIQVAHITWGRGFHTPPRTLAGFGFTLLASTLNRPTDRFFRPERSWDSPFQSFHPVIGVANLFGSAGLSCWFQRPASELYPPQRAVLTPTVIRLLREPGLS